MCVFRSAPERDGSRHKTDELRTLPVGCSRHDARQPGAVRAAQTPTDGGRRRPASARRVLPHCVRLRPPHLPVRLPEPEGAQTAECHLHTAVSRWHHDVPVLHHVAVLSAIDVICSRGRWLHETTSRRRTGVKNRRCKQNYAELRRRGSHWYTIQIMLRRDWTSRLCDIFLNITKRS